MNHDQDFLRQQLDVVLNLNRLTKQDELEWRYAEPERSFLRTQEEAYRAVFDGLELRVEEVANPLKDVPKHRIEFYDGSFRLRVIDPASGDDKIVIPPLAAVDDLAAIIRKRLEAQVEAATASEGSMEDLKAFNQKLEQMR